MGKHTAPARPWQRTARTALAALVTVVTLFPLIVAELRIPADQYPELAGWLGAGVTLCAAVTRVLAIPAVNALLGRLRAEDGPPS